ncbi:helix-turn-helix domain-containing protein [Danxiaibacter flavus]|nr:helix-turn-helix transcriptional regulator [Chitinophagaceae bacterium DXS]
MLQLMKEAVGSDVAATKKEWCELIGIRQSNLIEVESGKRGFTIEQIVKAAEITDVSTDWILGLSKTRTGSNEASGIELIKEGIRLIESEKIKGKKGKTK